MDDPSASLPILQERYGADNEIDPESAALANPAYIGLMTSPFTDANGLLSVDPARMGDEILPALETAGATVPAVDGDPRHHLPGNGAHLVVTDVVHRMPASS